VENAGDACRLRGTVEACSPPAWEPVEVEAIGPLSRVLEYNIPGGHAAFGRRRGMVGGAP
jgi:hypothetical protein